MKLINMKILHCIHILCLFLFLHLQFYKVTLEDHQCSPPHMNGNVCDQYPFYMLLWL